MTEIKELLKPGEGVVKKQEGITVYKGVPGIPSGDLILTNKRLIFLRKKRWAPFSPVPTASLMGEDIQIPLEDIKAIDKSMGNLKIKVSTSTTPLKEYQFATAVWNIGSWVESIHQIMHTTTPESANQQPYQMPHTIVNDLDEQEARECY